MSTEAARPSDDMEDQPYRQHFDDDDDPTELIEEEDDDKDERLVVRFVPKVIDYAIVGVQITILISYFYVAYIWDEFGTHKCVADINSYTPLVEGAANKGVNVAKYFKIAIRWGFWMSLLTFLRAILAQIGLCMKKWVLLWCSYVLFAANISIGIVLFILMQVWRWSHSGKVCSGEYIGTETVNPEDYLIFEGKFIKAILIAIYSVLGLSTLSILIVSICFYRRQRNALDEETNDPDNRASTRIRESAFTKALDGEYEAAMRESARSEMRKQFFPDNKQTEN